MKSKSICIVAWLGLIWAGAGSALAAETATVRIDTSLGPITLELYPEKAPVTVRNFLEYVDRGFYDATIFHRVIPNFMVQAGGFSVEGTRKPSGPPIPNESANGLRNERGAIAMARTSHPHSARSEFFINTVDNPFLDRENMPVREDRDGSQGPFGYAVFGRVIDGMPVIDRIQSVRTGTRGPMKNWPVEPVVIVKMQRVEAVDADGLEARAEER